MFFRKKRIQASLSAIPRITSDDYRVGNYYLDTSNRFIRYEQLSQIDPYVATSLLKLGLTISSGFELSGGVKELEKWAVGVNLDHVIATVARLLARDGTVVLHLEWDGDTISSLTPLPMRYITLLPKGVRPKEIPTHILKGRVDRAVVQEESVPTVFNREEFALFRLFPEGNVCTDIMGRTTLGLYGISLLDPIDRIVKYKLDLLEGFTKAVRRYGMGRLHIDMKGLEPLLHEGRFEEIKKVLDDVKEEMQKLEQNEDIVGVGFEVKPLTPTTGATDILGLKESLERDIAIALLQSEITTGKARGSTYASSYVSEKDRLNVLMSMQRQIKRVFERDVLIPQMRAWGYDEMVEMRFSPLDIS
ncbi:hypothetical protein DRN72_02575 [Methanosarcinales archaeon]|nr:MAG: hypothetical protein DRN72_02575 [Methanosarcinales archaeon]